MSIIVRCIVALVAKAVSITKCSQDHITACILHITELSIDGQLLFVLLMLISIVAPEAHFEK